jgi:hypothetical protein
MRRLVASVTDKLAPLDPAFAAERHLSVSFRAWSTGELYGQWRHGNLALPEPPLEP